jgi:WD40 repeat protein
LSVVFSHDSRQLASASRDHTVKIWATETGKCLQTLEGHGDWVWSVVFSHDSRQLASASNDHTVKIWATETGKCLQTLEGHGDWVWSVVFSHDSRQLASASYDRTVKIWDTETGKCLQTLEIGFLASPISFDPTGSYLFIKVGTFALGQSSSVRRIAIDSGYAPVIGDNVSVPDDLVGLQEHDWGRYGLSSDRAWITWRGQNLLWLPSEYRPGVFVISGSAVGIGCGNGRIIVLCFSPAGPGCIHNKALEA